MLSLGPANSSCPLGPVKAPAPIFCLLLLLPFTLSNRTSKNAEEWPRELGRIMTDRIQGIYSLLLLEALGERKKNGFLEPLTGFSSWPPAAPCWILPAWKPKHTEFYEVTSGEVANIHGFSIIHILLGQEVSFIGAQNPENTPLKLSQMTSLFLFMTHNIISHSRMFTLRRSPNLYFSQGRVRPTSFKFFHRPNSLRVWSVTSPTPSKQL